MSGNSKRGLAAETKAASRPNSLQLAQFPGFRYPPPVGVSCDQISDVWKNQQKMLDNDNQMIKLSSLIVFLVPGKRAVTLTGWGGVRNKKDAELRLEPERLVSEDQCFMQKNKKNAGVWSWLR